VRRRFQTGSFYAEAKRADKRRVACGFDIAITACNLVGSEFRLAGALRERGGGSERSEVGPYFVYRWDAASKFRRRGARKKSLCPRPQRMGVRRSQTPMHHEAQEDYLSSLLEGGLGPDQEQVSACVLVRPGGSIREVAATYEVQRSKTVHMNIFTEQIYVGSQIF
jgi:hypothetical protein